MRLTLVLAARSHQISIINGSHITTITPHVADVSDELGSILKVYKAAKAICGRRLDDRVPRAQPGRGNRWRMTGLGVQPRCRRRNVLSLSMTCHVNYHASVDPTKEYPSCPSGSLSEV
jgi:hypothetical protein